jgi:hypothetical protein
MIFILSFSIQLFAANNAPYGEPEFHLDNAPTAMALGKTYTIDYTIKVPGEPDITGTFDVTPSSTGEEITTVGNPDKITVQYNYHFSNGGWHYETKVFDLKITSVVYKVDKINLIKTLGLIGKSVYVSAKTYPTGYENELRWEITGGTANPNSGSGGNISFIPNDRKDYTIKAYIPDSINPATEIFTAVKVTYKITKPDNKPGHILSLEASGDNEDNFFETRKMEYILLTNPMGVVTNAIGFGNTSSTFNGSMHLETTPFSIGSLVGAPTSILSSYKAEQQITGTGISNDLFTAEKDISNTTSLYSETFDFDDNCSYHTNQIVNTALTITVKNKVRCKSSSIDLFGITVWEGSSSGTILTDQLAGVFTVNDVN